MNWRGWFSNRILIKLLPHKLASDPWITSSVNNNFFKNAGQADNFMPHNLGPGCFFCLLSLIWRPDPPFQVQRLVFPLTRKMSRDYRFPTGPLPFTAIKFQRCANHSLTISLRQYLKEATCILKWLNYKIESDAVTWERKVFCPWSQYNKTSSSQSLDPDQFKTARLYND